MERNARPSGAVRRVLWAYLFSTDHRAIGLAYFLTGFAMFFAGLGIMVLMRWQAAYPGKAFPLLGRFLGPDHPWMPGGVLLPNFYNQLGAMHGTTMVFLAVVPILVGGFGTYVVPLMLGANNLAFPRLSRVGFWCYLGGIAVIYASLFTQAGPANTGWTSYPPLSVIEHAGQSFWLVGILFVYLSSLVQSINLIVTVVQLRAPGMGFMQLPFFVWTQLVTAFLLLLAFPPLAAAGVLQLSDRLIGTSFFLPSGLVVAGQTLDASGGGSALLWQHLFWFLAHPEVYVLILPALGIVATIIPANTDRELYGYRGMVLSALFMGGMSFLVWAHHMYLTGMGAGMSRFFQTTTIIISVPSVVIGGSLVLSLWGGAIRFTPPMLYALAFLPMFGLGGLTGLPLAMPSTNIPLHDTMYVVGHFHYIVVLGTLFAVFGGIAHWFPTVSGRYLHGGLARLHFGLSLLFLNAVFLPLMLQGMAGVSRRLYDGGASYAHGREVFFLNKAVTHSIMAFAFVQLLFIVNVLWSLRRGKRATNDPCPVDASAGQGEANA